MGDKNTDRSRVLVVDDERVIADTLGAILRSAGFEVEVAYSGESALSTALQFGPDIVIADYSMPPGMNGMEACVQIKRSLTACRIIMLSGQPLAEVFAPYRADGYSFILLSKPVHPDELIQIVKSETITDAVITGQPRILNVDDVEMHRYSVSRALVHAGFQVIEAKTGLEALRKAAQSEPELILLDIHLPDLNGYEVCAALRKDPKTKSVPVMHVTASAFGPESRQRSAAAGADDFLAAPFLAKTLVCRARQLLQVRYLQGS